MLVARHAEKKFHFTDNEAIFSKMSKHPKWLMTFLVIHLLAVLPLGTERESFLLNVNQYLDKNKTDEEKNTLTAFKLRNCKCAQPQCKTIFFFPHRHLHKYLAARVPWSPTKEETHTGLWNVYPNTHTDIDSYYDNVCSYLLCPVLSLF